MNGLVGIIIFIGAIWLIIKGVKALRRGSTGGSDKNANLYRDERESFDDEYEIRVSISTGREDYRYREDPGDPDQCWIPAGQSVRVKNYAIPDGMVYVGNHLGSVDRYWTEPALIDPGERINPNSPDLAGDSFSYWPSYSEIPPRARATYLKWLSEGKKDPSIGMGYVFIYFYGIERRCLADSLTSLQAVEEIPTLLKEVKRLLQIYGGNGSFNSYASRFLDYIKTSSSLERKVYEQPPPSIEGVYDTPLALKVGLGQMVMDAVPIPVGWAFNWVLSDPNTYLRTPGKRCFQELKQLFRMRYEAKYGQGMKLKPNKTKIRLLYRPASGSFGAIPEIKTDICDVTALSGPQNRLREIIDDCQSALDSYSRLLGRNPDAVGTLPALALLPVELVGESDETGLKAKISEEMGGRSMAEVRTKDFISHWPTKHPDRMLKSEATILAQLLEKWGWGLEPDPRFGGPPLKEQLTSVVFNLPQDSPQTPSKEYTSAALLMHLAAMVAVADDEVSEEERNLLKDHLAKALKLSPGEEMRLLAHLGWLLLNPPGMAGIKKRLDNATKKQKGDIGWFLVSVAAADGIIHPDEVKALTKIYKTLGFNPDDVFSHIHELSTTIITDGPVTVRPAKDQPTGYSVPPEPKAVPGEGGPQVLDMKLVRKKMEETATVSVILGDIFQEEDDEPGQLEPATTGQTVAGLDEYHTALLQALIAKPVWDRASFDELAATWNLPPEGALENLNEAAYDLADEPLCEDGDPLEINQEVVKEMMAA